MPKHKILLCVDNSTASNHAVALSAILGRVFGSEVVAAHVYAARLHDRRFTDLEPGLPARYQEPGKLESSRRVHADLIGRGLEMISESYLEAARSRLARLPVRVKSIEGTNYVELARESADGYDLIVIGARGLGLASMDREAPPGMLGSVCERVLRRTGSDVLVVRDDRPPEGTILVALDGSPEAYAALRKAINLAKPGRAKIEAVTCFDPDYHPVAFKAVSDVLSEAQGKEFKFHQQQKLHSEIIDGGLENLYRGYLDNAMALAEGKGFVIETRVLSGKPAYEVARRAGRIGASLVVTGRFGRHRTPGLDIGGTAEAIVRLAPANVLVVNETPDEDPLPWTAEAEDRLQRVPQFMRPMVRKAIELHARARGLPEVTADTVTDAKTGHGVPMPGHGPDEASGA